MLYDCKAEARPPDMPAAAAIGAVEPFKDARQMFRGNTGTVVGNFDINTLLIHAVAAGSDIAAPVAVLQAVLDEVCQNLMNPRAVCINKDRTLRTLLEFQPDPEIMRL